MRVWLRALRVHQWTKNALLLAPAIAAHLPFSAEVATTLLMAFSSFSFLASAVYLLNDITDLEYDRAHPAKRRRPLASGEIKPPAAVIAISVLLLASLFLALRLPSSFLLAWVAYLVLTTAYSFGLKRVIMLDVVILAALYTVRVVAGAAAVDVELSRWFLAFAVFLFLSLALLKRFVETKAVAKRGGGPLPGRGYRTEDEVPLLALGTAAGAVGSLVYCLYITGDDALLLYGRPDVLWLGLPLFLYWVARIWLLANRGEVHDDPIVFALRDPVSYAVLAAFVATLAAAT